jgi:hypothetical protein
VQARAKIPIVFAQAAPVINVIPVALPLGRLKLATSPAATGSTPTTNTIGTVVVAVLAAIAVYIIFGRSEMVLVC